VSADRLAAAVADVRVELARRYPVAVDNTTWRWDGGVRVDGGVLVAAQANAYVQGMTGVLGLDVPRPTVLSDLNTPWILHRWRRVTGEHAVDLHRKDEGDDLQTQWSPPAWLRAYVDRGARTLVQLPDGTVGWTVSARLETGEPEADPWAAILRPRKGEAVDAGSLDVASSLARARIGRPYRWGGNTEAAADCSGFVQTVVQGASDVLLPKNTKDQRQQGSRVSKTAIGPGDLVFVRGRNSRLSHVGLALPSPAGTTVIHSCLSRERILEEPLAAFLERYDFLGARRPVAWIR
jgi:hypothetical protein